jgi:hypothetical protein
MTPEQHIAGAARPFTGAEYIDSLKDGRAVYISVRQGDVVSVVPPELA